MDKGPQGIEEIYQIVIDYYEAFAHLLEVGTEGEKRFAIETFRRLQSFIKERLETFSGERKEQFLQLRALLQQDTTGLGDFLKESSEKIRLLKAKVEPEIEKVTKTKKKKTGKGRMERNIRSKS